MAAKDLTFAYRPLKIDCIRLIQLLPTRADNSLCFALHENISYTLDEVSYKALSYCWGDATAPKSILLNGSPFFVTSNLYAVLSVLAARNSAGESGQQCFWIDAICINQSDIDERAQQVSQMWRIYSKAQQVIAWLGPEDRNTAILFSRLNDMGTEIRDNLVYDRRKAAWVDRSTVDPEGTITDTRDALAAQLRAKYADEQLISQLCRALLRREYFTRLWMVTECTQAQNLMLLCGCNSCSWESLDLYIFLYLDDKRQADVFPPAPLRSRTLVRGWPLNDEGKPVLSLTGTIYCLTSYFEGGCSDPRDRVYAMTGHPAIRVLDPDMLLKPDYTLTTDEVLIVAIAWLETILGANSPSLAIARAMLVAFAKGLEIDVTNKTFEAWVRSHDGWDCSSLPTELTLSTRKKVPCTGAYFTYYLTGTWPDKSKS